MGLPAPPPFRFDLPLEQAIKEDLEWHRKQLRHSTIQLTLVLGGTGLAVIAYAVITIIKTMGA